MSSNKIRAYALDLLARREHSKVELQRKLSTKGFPLDNITTLLQELENKGLQNDNRFIESYINMRRSRGFGPLKIKGELKNRGIDQEIAADLLDEKDPIWFDLAKTVYHKKFGKNIPLKDWQRKAQQIRYLQYKGFTNDQIKKVITHEKTV